MRCALALAVSPFSPVALAQTQGTFVTPIPIVPLNMLVIHNDPRTEELTTAITQVSRSEPNPAIFAVPADYKIVSRQL